MTTAIVVIWILGLLGALPATLVICKESLLLIRTLDDIRRIANVTASTADAVEVNTRAVSLVRGMGETLRPLDAALDRVATPLEQLSGKLAAGLR